MLPGVPDKFVLQSIRCVLQVPTPLGSNSQQSLLRQQTAAHNQETEKLIRKLSP
jgi:hypothetical protein